MDRRPVISAFVLFLAGILPAGPASQKATAAQGATLAARFAGGCGRLLGSGRYWRAETVHLECRGRGSPQ